MHARGFAGRPQALFEGQCQGQRIGEQAMAQGIARSVAGVQLQQALESKRRKRERSVEEAKGKRVV